MSAIDTSCYNLALGLSRYTCPCTEGPAEDSNYNVSDSDLYITDLQPLDKLEGFGDCGVGSIWDALARAKQRAILTFIGDTNALMARNYKRKRTPFIGGVGRAESQANVSTAYAYNGMRIACAPVRGGYLTIRGVAGRFSVSGDLTLKIFDNHNVLKSTKTVACTAGKHVLLNFTAAVELPMYDEYGDVLEYFMVYEVDTAPGVAAENRVYCPSCGMVTPYDLQAPHWNGHYQGSWVWANWIMLGGWEGNTLTDFDTAPDRGLNKCFGLVASIEIGCKASEVLCKNELNFATNPLAMSSAIAIQHKAAEYTVTEILNSPKLNRAQMSFAEALKSEVNDWRAKYNEHVQYITQNVDLSGNDCLCQKGAFAMSMQSVLG